MASEINIKMQMTDGAWSMIGEEFLDGELVGAVCVDSGTSAQCVALFSQILVDHE